MWGFFLSPHSVLKPTVPTEGISSSFQTSLKEKK